MFVAAGFCAHGLAGAGGIGKVMAEWIAEGEPSLDLWEMDVRRFGAQYRSPAYTHARIRETYETYYDIRYPNHERRPGGRCGSSPANAWHARARRRLRREVGLGAGQLVRVERRRRRRVAAPPRLGGPALVARDRRRAPRHPRGAWRSSTRPRSRRWRSRARAPPSCSSASATTGSPARSGKITYTQMLNSRGGIECDFTVARLGRGALLDRHRHRVRQPRPRVDPQAPARATARVQVRDVTSAVGVLRDLGPAGARRARAADPAGPLATRPSPTCRVREITVGNVPVRALRVTYVGELGWELYCPTRVRARPLAGAVGGGRAARDRRRRLPGDRLDAAREGLPGLGRRHHPRRDPLRGRASASASSSTRRAASSAATRWPRRRSAARGPGSAA